MQDLHLIVMASYDGISNKKLTYFRSDRAKTYEECPTYVYIARTADWKYYEVGYGNAKWCDYVKYIRHYGLEPLFFFRTPYKCMLSKHISNKLADVANYRREFELFRSDQQTVINIALTESVDYI
jgi:hypothetical protein